MTRWITSNTVTRFVGSRHPMFNCAPIQRALLTFRVLFVMAGICSAQPAVGGDIGCIVNPHNAAAAAALFQEGYKLRQEGKDEAACKKFQESARLDAMAGTLLNLAECRANQGKTATAAGWYHKAAILAENQGDQKLLEKAKEHARELDAEVSYLKIRIERPVPGIVVRRDDDVVGPAQFNESLPIDPGEHTVTAVAPGYRLLSIAVHIGEVSDNKTVDVPALELLPPPARARTVPALPNVQSKPGATHGATYWPWVIGGVGVSAIAVGTVSGILALHDKSRVADRCTNTVGCKDAEAYSLQSQRDTEWALARIAFPAGVVALGTAATWLLLEKRDSEQPRHERVVQTLGASVDAHGSQLWVSGRF